MSTLMGTPVPEEFPDLVDGKYYCVTVDFFEETDPEKGCDNPYVGTAKACLTGSYIKDWQDRGGQCKVGDGLIPPHITAPQRITSCHGPYNTGDACWLDCEP